VGGKEGGSAVSARICAVSFDSSSSSSSCPPPLPPFLLPVHTTHSYNDPTVRMELERHPFSVIEHEGNYSGIGFALNDEVHEAGREGGREGRREGEHKARNFLLTLSLPSFFNM